TTPSQDCWHPQCLDLILGDEIGSGASAKVFIGHWRGLRVAVKEWTVADGDGIILHEIELHKRLRHDNIIQFLEAGLVDGTRNVMVTAFAKHGNLSQVLQGYRLGVKLDWAIKTKMGGEIASALVYLHAMGIIHRDLKCANVLVNAHLEARLCDFGHALDTNSPACSSSSSHRLARPVGTSRWWAPELMRDFTSHSTASDMYALGMVLWEMAADGMEPFKHLISPYFAQHVLSGGRETIPEGTPDDFSWWIQRCWKENPADRPKADEMVHVEISGFGALARNGWSTLSVSKTTIRHKSLLPPPSPPSAGSLMKGVADETMSPARAKSIRRRGRHWIRSDLTAIGEWGMTEVMSIYLPGLSDQCLAYVAEAVNGNRSAQLTLGRWRLYGAEGLPINHKEAHHWLNLAAKEPHGLASASRLLSALYERGVGVIADPNQAFQFLIQAAQQGDLRSQLEVSARYRTSHHDISSTTTTNSWAPCDAATAAFEWMYRAAESGAAVAEYGLGWHYEYGFGVVADQAEATRLYHQAAKKGDRQAQNRLGWLHQVGQGGGGVAVVQHNIETAVNFYREAAAQGHVEAHFRLYALYARGYRRCGRCHRHSLETRLHQQLRKYRRQTLNALSGSTAAAASTSTISTSTSASSPSPAAVAATNTFCHLNQLDHIRRRAAMNDPVALFDLGQIYEHGDDGLYLLQPDDLKACELYKRAVQLKHVPAFRALGALYLSGRLGHEAYQEAQAMLIYAADRGDVQAMTWLAWSLLLKEGEVSTKPSAVAAVAAAAVADIDDENMGTIDAKYQQAEDVNGAIHWLIRAASQAEPIALATLGRLYDRGEAGLAKDPERARSYYLQAARSGNPTAQIWLSKTYASAGDGGGDGDGDAWNWEELAEHWFAVASQQ
ncbi:hypothetical protein DFQ27_004697, partial [Actinomortierella ambigua]